MAVNVIAELQVLFKVLDQGASASVRQLNTAIEGTGRAAKQAESPMGNLLNYFTALPGKAIQMTASFGAAMLVFTALQTVIGGTFDAMIGLNSQMEQATVAFTTMSGSAEAANKHVQDLKNFARETPFHFDDVLEASKRLQAFGFSIDEVIPDLTTLGNIAAGVGMDKLPQLILAFGQVSTAGRLMGTELRQFNEAGVPLTQALADAYGKTTAQMQGMIHTGQIGFASVKYALEGLTAEGGRFNNLMENQSHTFAGAMSNVQDSISFIIAHGFEPFFKKISETANKFADFLMSDEAAIWSDNVSTALISVVNGFESVGKTMETLPQRFHLVAVNLVGQLMVLSAQVTDFVHGPTPDDSAYYEGLKGNGDTYQRRPAYESQTSKAQAWFDEAQKAAWTDLVIAKAAINKPDTSRQWLDPDIYGYDPEGNPFADPNYVAPKEKPTHGPRGAPPDLLAPKGSGGSGRAAHIPSLDEILNSMSPEQLGEYAKQAMKNADAYDIWYEAQRKFLKDGGSVGVVAEEYRKLGKTGKETMDGITKMWQQNAKDTEKETADLEKHIQATKALVDEYAKIGVAVDWNQTARGMTAGANQLERLKNDGVAYADEARRANNTKFGLDPNSGKLVNPTFDEKRWREDGERRMFGMTLDEMQAASTKTLAIAAVTRQQLQHDIEREKQEARSIAIDVALGNLSFGEGQSRFNNLGDNNGVRGFDFAAAVVDAIAKLRGDKNNMQIIMDSQVVGSVITRTLGEQAVTWGRVG